jgi:hypothetical protein
MADFIKVTVDIYGHLVPGANKSAVDRLNNQAPFLENYLDKPLARWYYSQQIRGEL